MIDRDLAELYGVETRVLNQAVKRNMERFPERFRFQLTKEESSRRKTKQFSSYFRFPTSHTTVRAVPHTAVPILDTIRDTLPLK